MSYKCKHNTERGLLTAEEYHMVIALRNKLKSKVIK